VVIIKALFYLNSFWLSISQSYLACFGSNPVDGSSRKIISGYPTKAIAIDTLLYIPPDNSLALKSLNSVNPTSLMANSTYKFSSAGEIPFNLA